MADLVLKDRVREVSYSTGTSNFVLSGAYTGYQTFSGCIPDGSVVYYCATNGQAGSEGQWEVGYGTYSLGGNSISRLAADVYDSSSGPGTLVTFSNPSTLTVFITQPAEQAVYQQTNGDVIVNQGVMQVSLDGTALPKVDQLPNVAFQAFSTINSYMQTNMQNLANGSSSSADYVATADAPFGTDTDNYMDVGIASSGYNYPEFSGNPALSGYIQCTADNGVVIQAGKYGANVAAANASATDIVFSAGDLLTSGYRGYIKGSTGNWILGPYGSTDTGEKLQVLGTAKITGNVTFGANVTLSTNPSTALEAATKQYVDNATSTGIHIHTPCTSETSAALSAVYTQGGTTFNITDITGTNTVVTSTTHGLSVNDEIWLTTTAGNGLSINTPYFVYSTPTTTSLQLSTSYGGALLTGLTNASGLSYATRANSGVGAYLEASANQALPVAGVIVGDRVLVYNQSTGYWNGVYTVTALGAADPGGSKWKLTRATDANKYQPDNTTGMGAGDYFFIQSNSEAYVLTDPTGPIIIGYDAITYTLFSSVPAYTVNPPLSLVGTTLSLGTVPADLGGTNLTSYTSGDMLYATGATTLSKRAIGNTGNTLIVSGGFPTWGSIDLASANAVSSTLGATNGGTGQSSYVLGDLLYSSATNTLSKLAGQTTTTKKYLQQQGDGVNSAAPSWQQIAAADISGLAPSATTDTSNATNITSGTLPSGRLSGSYTGVTGVGNLTAGTWSANVITTAYGGTGTAGTITGVMYGNGASAMTAATGSQIVSVIGSTAVANATYAVSANSATYSSNLIGGLAGGIPYQTGANATTILAAGTGVLVGGSTPAYSTTPTLTGTNFSGIPNSATTASASNGASTIVARDINGSFAANVVTANLTGTASLANNSTYLNGQLASYYQPASTAITTSNIGSQSVSYATSAGSATSATSASNADTVDNLHAVQFFNNMGNNHSTYADFNAPTDFGYRYIQGTTNGPGIASASQYYNWGIGLGNDYAYTSYAMQMAIPRTPLGGNPYMAVRYREGGTWGSWSKIYAGYADTAGNGGVTSVNGQTGAVTVSTTPSANSVTRAMLYKTDNDGSGIIVGADGAIFINPKTITANTTIPANYGASSTGPITINTGVTVTVSTGSNWVIL